jgi:hypothetical protein
MTDFPGGVEVTGYLSPSATTDTYPTHDSRFGMGGGHEVADLTARNAIPSARRREGMTCYTQNDQQTWQLQGGILDSNWVNVSSGGGGGGIFIVSQTGHGFSVGNWLYFNSAVWTFAKADAFNTSEVEGIVSAVSSVDQFTLCTSGPVGGLTGLTPGSVYFLSDAVAGTMTATKPVATNSVAKPVFIATSTTGGLVKIEIGTQVGAGYALMQPNTIVFTTGSLAPGTGAIYTVPMQAYQCQIRNVYSDHPCRFRIYGTSALATLDYSRPASVKATGNNGLYLEMLMTPVFLSWINSPIPTLLNQDSPMTQNLYFSIQNTGSTTTTITLTISTLKME